MDAEPAPNVLRNILGIGYRQDLMSLEMNKIAAAVLTGGIVAMLSGFVAGKLYHPEQLEEPAFRVALPEGGAAPQPEEPTLEPILGLLATADIAAGERAARACVACHTFEKGGANKVGPNLWNIVNEEFAHIDGFNYSDTLEQMKAEGKRWTYSDLNAFLENPRAYAPGTRMTYAGMRQTQRRADLIAYMRTFADEEAPLPTQEEIDAVTKTDDDSAAAPTEGGEETQTASADAATAGGAAASAPAESDTAAAGAGAGDTTAAGGAQQTASAAATTGGTAQAATAGAAAGGTQTAAAPGGDPELDRLIAAASPDAGKRVARKCVACHTFEQGGVNKVGPNLFDVIGKTAGVLEGYNFSPAMVAAGEEGFTWTYKNLDDYLANPRKVVPRTKMAFPGLRKPEERADIIAYMRTMAENPPPLSE